jgi:hypothetical protein
LAGHEDYVVVHIGEGLDQRSGGGGLLHDLFLVLCLDVQRVFQELFPAHLGDVLRVETVGGIVVVEDLEYLEIGLLSGHHPEGTVDL